MTDRELLKKIQEAFWDWRSLSPEWWDKEDEQCLDEIEARLTQPELQQRIGDCLLTGVCASEGHRIQKAQWQGLTDEQRKEILQREKDFWGLGWELKAAEAIELELKEKNT